MKNSIEELNSTIVELIEELKKKDKIEILQTKEVAKILKVNPNKARIIMARSDFPSFAGNRKVEKTALYQWLQTRHEDSQNTKNELKIVNE